MFMFMPRLFSYLWGPFQYQVEFLFFQHDILSLRVRILSPSHFPLGRKQTPKEYYWASNILSLGL